MRLLNVRILGLVGVLALLCSFGLLTQARPAAASGPTAIDSMSHAGALIVAQAPDQTEVRDNSSVGMVQEEMASNPSSYVGFHVERRLKLRRWWTAEDGMYCKIKGGGDVFVPWVTPETDLSC